MLKVPADGQTEPAFEINAASIAELAGKFDLDLLKGGTFTVSNLGSVGGTYSTPIINPPQVAILLVGRSRMVPHMHDEKLVARLMMPEVAGTTAGATDGTTSVKPSMALSTEIAGVIAPSP